METDANKPTEFVAPIEAEVVAIDAYSRAEYDIQIATAKKFPRSLAQFKRKAIELATFDDETAASCLYALPRAGKTIEGESIRLAEIVASSYGNIVYGARVLNKDSKTTRVVGFAWDLENNVRAMIEKEGRITDKNGKTYGDDMIIVATNATVAKAVRDAIFKVVPKSLVKDVVNRVKALVAGDANSIKDKRATALKLFKDTYGVEAKTIYEFLDVKGVDDISSDHLISLFGMHSALQEADPIERKAMIEGMKKPIAQQTEANSTPKAKI
jgi:hypothetical protein